MKQNEQLILDNKTQIGQTDIGSFRFIARSFNVETDVAVKWFMLIIVLVFDPLAVCLVIGYNALIGSKDDPSGKNSFSWFSRSLDGWFHRGKSVVERTEPDKIRAHHRPNR